MSQKIKIMILGGARENGKNMYAVQVEDEIFIMDAGLKYPDSSLLGIDVVIPDLQFFQDYADKIAGIFLTHGHADSIGALPYILGDHDIPVFGSKLTIELAKIAVQRENRRRKNDLFHVIDADTEIEFKNANVSFFKTTHSIPDSLGIDISTKEGEIVYTGDFKFDPSAKKGYRTDFVRLSEIAQKGVLALLSDSTNAEANFPNDRQTSIEKYIYNIFENYDGRIIAAAKASNIVRVQEIFQAAAATGRHVFLTGRDAGKIVYTAMKLGYLNVPKGLLVHSKDLKKIPDNELVILETGRMGEPLKSLQKMATNRHRMIKIKKGDLVFIATTPSHSVETMVAQTSDMIYRAGGTVKELGRDKHTSGHATGRDLQMLIDTLKPKFLIPVIGEYRLLEIHKDLAIEAGMNKKDIFLPHNGDAYALEKGRFYRTDAVPGEDIMIDGSGVGDVGNIVLRDREVLSDDGVFIAAVTIDRKKKKIISEPRVSTRGFVYIKANHALMNGAADVIKEAVNNNFEHKKFDWTELKQDVRNDVEKYLYKQTGRRPVVLPVVMEVNQNRHRAMARRNNQENNSEKRPVRKNHHKKDSEQKKAKA
ncbi:ribonuclease J [Lactobacillus johnsonii]|uniref:Ribonuclease J n=1 Tax=Lactobacillus johnsonii TaxID=33959 RepID=A0A9X6RWA4_LACJH|nr:ribonuclease J [Lactobacillus johnsonii]OYS05020.1 RNase J family beta-CASP ribonuclease [Lactobacillus johnsonii]OYS08031.1 RNase J family beta-CASP ribonuclease [Lactobacillus johnsonii]OYS08600.1 RNase J family beta-CASP ribonuclease [Lactobacillus johnsonii]OYS09791.1 RNase J family beta-CASP ribonuclease [Lactobacillus johnsonii]OYS11657.1 RNase J family beta-CASP ribonuclease [Lactobacillus johnsonii]